MRLNDTMGLVLKVVTNSPHLAPSLAIMKGIEMRVPRSIVSANCVNIIYISIWVFCVQYTVWISYTLVFEFVGGFPLFVYVCIACVLANHNDQGSHEHHTQIVWIFCKVLSLFFLYNINFMCVCVRVLIGNHDQGVRKQDERTVRTLNIPYLHIFSLLWTFTLRCMRV